LAQHFLKLGKKLLERAGLFYWGIWGVGFYYDSTGQADNFTGRIGKSFEARLVR
jgi:hypothetical protein